MKGNKFVNFLLPLYFFMGMLKGISIFAHLDYILSIFIQIYVFSTLLKKNEKLNSKKFAFYLINIFIILCIGLYFAYIGSELFLIINRILPLISIFGLLIINANENLICFKVILNRTILLFSILACLMLIDYLAFLSIHRCIWEPISYLGYRYSGPFFDSNFMSITYGTILLLLLYMKKKKKIIPIILCLLCIFIAKSWSTIIIIALSFFLHTILKIKFKNLFFKQIVFIAIDVLFILLCQKYMSVLMNDFISFMSKTSFSIEELTAKFNSFKFRIDAQYKSLNLFLNMPLGHGPRTIVSFLNMDIHNSYLGFLFEQGLLGFFLQIINVPLKNNKYIVCDIISTFIFIVAFFINIHYSSIFVLGILILFFFNNERGETNEIFNNYASL